MNHFDIIMNIVSGANIGVCLRLIYELWKINKDIANMSGRT